ncbi:MAG: hypothetical protein ABIE92_13210, partial [bacterium]
MEWQKRKILIWGKTRPELSSKHREVVCTGGVFEDTKDLVRLYPIPLRYIDDEKIFRKYQWIEAEVKKAEGDNRPESFKILPESIKVDGILKTKRGDWSERAAWILNDKNIYQSVEALQEKQSKDFTSLGLVKPLEVLDVQSKPVSISEKHDFWTKYEEATQQ